MMAGSSGSFKDSMILVVRKKREYLNFLIENGLDLNFETQVFMEIQNN